MSRQPGTDVTPIPLGESRSMRVGQKVYAIGNPFGLQRTLTQGVVSALDRELPTTTYREVVGVIEQTRRLHPGVPWPGSSSATTTRAASANHRVPTSW